MSNDWLPSREQDLVDLCQKWKSGMEDPAKAAALGWNQTGVTAALGTGDAFLTARAAYEAENSTAKRIAKDEAGKRPKARCGTSHIRASGTTN